MLRGCFPSLGRVGCFPCFRLLGLVTLSLRSRFGLSGPCFVDCSWLCLLCFCFFLVHHRFSARSDCGLGLRPLPAFAFLGFRFSCVLLLTSLPLDDRDDWLAGVFFPFGSAGLQLKIRLWFSDTRAGCESSCERSFILSCFIP